MKRILPLIIMLTGCVETFDYIPYRSDIGYQGDSLCGMVFDVEQPEYGHNQDSRKTAPARAGFLIDCVIGRQAMDIEKVIQRRNGEPWRVFFLALGTNDILKGVDINTFKERYQQLVDSVDADRLYCVLPRPNSVLGRDTEPYRTAIMEICAEVVDPWDYGVRYRAKDGLHMEEFDNELWYYGLLELIK